MIKLLAIPKLKAADKTQLKELKEPFIKIIKKYEEYFNDEENEDEINEDMTPEDVEKILDEKITKYSKLSNTNPMEYVNWHATKKRYRLRYKKIELLFKTLDDACNKLRECKTEENMTIVEGVTKKDFSYKDHYFICYLYDDKPYFDIQHIISVLNLKKASYDDKYSEYKGEVKKYLWHKNTHDGYILRELINERTVYKIILSSNSTISKSFKNDVSKILCDLRKDGSVEITNDKIAIKTNTDKLKPEDRIPYMYDNPKHLQYAQSLISAGSHRSISHLVNCHILYAFIMSLKDTDGKITIKMGYTEDIIERFKSLKAEYKCDIFFICAKKIHGMKDEVKFHNTLKTKYASLVQPYKIGNNKKTELYSLNPAIMKEFDGYLREEEDTDEELDEELDEEQLEIITYIEKQDDIFLKLVEDYNNSFSDPSSMYNYLIIKENNKHDKFLKKIELEASKVAIETEKVKHANLMEMTKLKHANLMAFDKDERLLKLQIELNKSK